MLNTQNFSDGQLISDYLKGDEKSLEILIGRYLKPVYSFVYRHIGNKEEAENITQEVFIKAWRNLHKFNPKRNFASYRIEGSDAGFKTWIFSIARNVSIDWLRKKKTIPFSKFENEKGENALVDTLADSASLPDEIFEKAATAKVLNSAMRQLPPQYRMVLFLRYNDDFTFQEISEVFKESINTIKSRHRRALIMLKKMLADSKS